MSNTFIIGLHPILLTTIGTNWLGTHLIIYMSTIKIRTTQNIDLEYSLANVGYRIVAYMIDVGIFVALGAIIFLLFLSLIEQAIGDIGRYFSMGLFIVFALAYTFYDLICEVLLNGQSIGKKIMKIKVVRLDGAQPTLGNYLTRWIMRLIDITISTGSLAILLIAFGGKGQRLGDLAAGTTVISLAAPTQFDETIFVETEVEYDPLYPQVTKLSDKDIQLIKDIMVRVKSTRNTEILTKLHRKLETTMGIQSQQSSWDFVETLIKDYNHLNSEF